MRKIFTFITIIILIWSSSMVAATRNVPSQYATIQAAITAAVAGDTVIVAADATYIENINFLGKDITVKTPDPITDRFTTIIDGSGAGTVVKFVNNETNNARLQGFTIQNGTGTMHNWWYYNGLFRLAGGGIQCDSPYSYDPGASSDGSSPTLSYLVIQNNTAEMGGGLCSWLRSEPIIENTIVRNNVASRAGGGLYFIEAFSNMTAIPIPVTNVLVTNNTGGTEGGSGFVVNFSH